MQTIEDVIKKVQLYHPKVDRELLLEAYHFAEKAHAGQTRMSGEAYISHPLAVMDILADYGADEESLVAALLHDVVEDTDFKRATIQKKFGKNVAKMVEALTKLPQTYGQHPSQFKQFDFKIETIRKIFELMQKDVRIIVIKLCDRLHNMKTLHHFRPQKQQRIAQETLDFFVKIADRLCIYDLKEQLERLCFRFLQPERFEALDQLLVNNQERLDRNKKKILEKSQELPYLSKASQVVFRQWVPFQKLFRHPDRPMDISSQATFVLPDINTCYLAVQEIHATWKHLRGRFRDYISYGKSNGYQALETSVLKSDGTEIRFILQTQEMYDYSRKGVMLQCFTSSREGKKIHLPWVEYLKNIHQKTKSKSQDYIEAIQNDILKEAITIYTEDGKSLALPPKSTALDAAFYFLGTKAQYLTRIRVNDIHRQFSIYLKEGDKLSFKLGTRSQIDWEWLDQVSTTYSISQIHDIFSEMSPKKRIEIGHNLMQQEMHKRGVGYIEEINTHTFEPITKELDIKTLDDLYMKIAIGEVPIDRVCDMMFTSKEAKEQKAHLYDVQLEFVSHRSHSLSSFFSLFEDQPEILGKLAVESSDHNGPIVKGTVELVPSAFTAFKRTLHGLSDIRFVQLKEARQRLMGKWLLGIFMVLVALDPLFAFKLINDVGLNSIDFLVIRFLTIFVVFSGLVFVRQHLKTYVEESPINYFHKEFAISAVMFFFVSLCTYLAFSYGITPFAYQLSIYVVLFPFFSIYQERYHKSAMMAFLFGTTGLFLTYLGYHYWMGGLDLEQMLLALAVAIGFTSYTHYSTSFQLKEHIHRRYFSFFRTLSCYGLFFSVLLYGFTRPFTIPPLEHIALGVGFTIVFIIIPYILYFLISGIYSYTSSVWKRFITILLMVLVGEWLVLSTEPQFFDLAIGLLFVGGYWLFSRSLKKKIAEESRQND